MSKQNVTIAVCILLSLLGATASAQTGSTTSKVQPCPGYNPTNNTNLACELATGLKVTPANITAGNTTSAVTQTLPGTYPVVVSATVATSLSSLPIATAVSGTGITFINGIPTFSTESLGTILTQRGETLGRHRFFLSFNYQRFGFGSIDGVRFKDFDTVNTVKFPGVGTSYAVGTSRVDFKVDEYTALASFGVTSKIDLTLIVPFSTIRLGLNSSGHQYNVDSNGNPLSDFALGSVSLPGEKSGPGDLTISVKANVYRSQSEKTAIGVGSELRIPTGDETQYLGTGAYGVKPYAILSHHGKRITPSVNIGYQWNSSSSLYTNQNTGDHLNLPASFLYSGGADFRVTQRFTLNGEFVGQYVINGPRLVQTSETVPGLGKFNSIQVLDSNGNQITSSYGVNNAGFGFKVNPIGGLIISASAMFKLDDGGLRAKVVPLVGVSYRF